MTLSLPAPDPWQSEALCAEVGGDLWHPEKGGSARPAKEVCKSCDVTEDCLDWALTHNEHGIWGGKTEGERRRLLRKTTTLRKECGTTSGYWRHRSSREPACRPCLDAMRDDGRRRRAQGTA